MDIETIHLRTLQAKMQLHQVDYTQVFDDNMACIEWAKPLKGDMGVPSSLISASTSGQNGHTRLNLILKTKIFRDITTVLNERKHLKIVFRSVPDSVILFLDRSDRPGLTASHCPLRVNSKLKWAFKSSSH